MPFQEQDVVDTPPPDLNTPTPPLSTMPRASLGKLASTPVKSKSTPKSTPKATPKSTPTSAKATPTKASKGKAPAKLYSSFLPIPLDLPFPLASSSKSKASATHYIFVRPHVTKSALSDDQERAERTLFAANIPVDAGEHDLRTLFGNWGVVESIHLSGGSSGDVLESAVAGLPDSDDESDDESQSEEEEQQQQGEDGWTFVGTAAKESRKRRRKPAGLPASVPEVSPLDLGRSTLGQSGGRTAQIVFIDAVSVSRAMGYAGPSLPLALKNSEVGLKGYEARYASLRPPLPTVRAHSDSAMARHDHLHGMLLASKAKQHGAGALVDEDGFTVVVRGGRYGRTAGRGGAAGVGVAGRAAAKAALEKKKARGAAELKDFYRFQSVDRKRKELADMRARFDEDRRKVEDLKRQRRFKPY